MKKIFKIFFFLALPAVAACGIWSYYESLPIRGAYETGPISYPSIDKEELKKELSKYSQDDLFVMYSSGMEAIKWDDLLGRVNATVISDIVKDFNHFYISDRYPHNQVYDASTKCTYFYHTHRPKEHGHFHIYYSNKKVLDQFTPIVEDDAEHPSTHLVSLSMHPDGEPIGLFVPNHWVTKDDWYQAEDMKKILPQFEISHPYPSWPSNQWLSHILKLFRPQIEHVLSERDQFIADSEKPLNKIIKSGRLEILASIPISIPDQMDAIEELLDKDLFERTDK